MLPYWDMRVKSLLYLIFNPIGHTFVQNHERWLVIEVNEPLLWQMGKKQPNKNTTTVAGQEAIVKFILKAATQDQILYQGRKRQNSLRVDPNGHGDRTKVGFGLILPLTTKNFYQSEGYMLVNADPFYQ